MSTLKFLIHSSTENYCSKSLNLLVFTSQITLFPKKQKNCTTTRVPLPPFLQLLLLSLSTPPKWSGPEMRLCCTPCFLPPHSAVVSLSSCYEHVHFFNLSFVGTDLWSRIPARWSVVFKIAVGYNLLFFFGHSSTLSFNLSTLAEGNASMMSSSSLATLLPPSVSSSSVISISTIGCIQQTHSCIKVDEERGQVIHLSPKCFTNVLARSKSHDARLVNRFCYRSLHKSNLPCCHVRRTWGSKYLHKGQCYIPPQPITIPCCSLFDLAQTRFLE